MSQDPPHPGAGQNSLRAVVSVWLSLMALAVCLPACYEQVKPDAKDAATDLPSGTDTAQDLAVAADSEAPDTPDASPDLKAACPGGAGCACDKPSECNVTRRRSAPRPPHLHSRPCARKQGSAYASTVLGTQFCGSSSSSRPPGWSRIRTSTSAR